MFDTTHYTVLWSPSQKAFHLSTVEDMLVRNTRICIEGKSGDFITLSIHPTMEEAQATLDALRNKKDNKA